MPHRWVEPEVTVVLGDPDSHVAVVDDLDLPGLSMTRPQERSPGNRLITAADLGGVVRDRRAEIRSPGRLAVITIGTRVGENVHAAVPDLHGERIGVCVRRDAEVPVRPPIASAPYLGKIMAVRAQQRNPGLRGPSIALPASTAT